MDINEIKNLKGRRKITMLTAYDFATAGLIDKAGIDMILVGDSLANVVLGLESTKQVGMPEMLHHTKAVARAVKSALLIADMPFESYQLKPEEGVKNARRFVDEAGAKAVKIEWFEQALEVTGNIIKTGIPVMGHIGLTPQTVDKIGGFKCQGKDAEAAKKIIEQAKELEKAGCFSLVLECLPDKLAQIITAKIGIPTIGIGAGVYCDGQVLVTNDMLGLFEKYTPKFVKKYASLSGLISKAVEDFKNEVTKEIFPDKEHSFTIKEEELKKIENL
ncbi:MAG: 3-methyl-2-oxobutanoate hydroxymethyltransferase [Candidatus Omnitrophota bacterium]